LTLRKSCYWKVEEIILDGEIGPIEYRKKVKENGLKVKRVFKKGGSQKKRNISKRAAVAEYSKSDKIDRAFYGNRRR
jgi:hypothetical protein